MATEESKEITVDGDDFLVSDIEEFKALIDSFGASCLVNANGKRVVGFKSLVHGGKYTLGPPQQQDQKSAKRSIDDIRSIVDLSVAKAIKVSVSTRPGTRTNAQFFQELHSANRIENCGYGCFTESVNVNMHFKMSHGL